MTPARALLGVLVLAAASAPALADRGMRCGQSLVRPGDTKVDVLVLCGEPLARETVSGGAGAESDVVEQWLYSFGPQRFMRVLTFRGLHLRDIESGPYPR